MANREDLLLFMDEQKYYIESFKDLMLNNNCNIHLKGFLYFERCHTEYLKKLIKIENWGSKNKRLYHYLDHSFRINLMHNNIKIYSLFNFNKIAIFPIKLYKRNDKKTPINELCLILIPSYWHKNSATIKPWFLSKDLMNPFVMTKMEISRYYGIKLCDIPVYKVMYAPNAPQYNLSLRSFNKSWSDMLKKKNGKTRKNFIVDEFESQNNITFDMKYPQISKELLKPFTNAIKYFFARHFKYNINDSNTVNYNGNNNINENYIVPGIFWVNCQSQYKIRYHMLINVIYRHKKTKFVAVLQKDDDGKRYRVIKVITLEMGLCNTRLYAEITGIWKKWSNIMNKDELDILIDNIVSEYPQYCKIKQNT